MTRSFWARWLLVLVGSGLPACNDCDRTGCDAVTRKATEAGSSIAGVVAQRSDVVTDGCQECPLGAATLLLWTLQEPFESRAEAQALAAGRPADESIEVDGSYRHSLQPGWYLLGVRPNAVELSVHEDETLTVNVLRRDGSTGFFVGRPSSPALSEDFGYDIGF